MEASATSAIPLIYSRADLEAFFAHSLEFSPERTARFRRAWLGCPAEFDGALR